MWKNILLISSIGLLAASCAAVSDVIGSAASSGYQTVSITGLQEKMENKDFTLVNVHIPVDGNIAGTDAMIPFDKIENYLDQLPEKDAEIVLYCRSGSMSRTASETLLNLGYTNVYDLEGGYIAWQAAGLPFEE